MARRLLGILTFVWLIGGALATVAAFAVSGLPFGAGWIDGTAQRGAESHYDESFAARGASAFLWGVIDYLALSKAREGAVIGEDGWLFAEQEFTPQGGNVGDVLGYVEDVSGLLAQRGVELRVVVIPAKSELCSGALRQVFPPARAHDFAEFRGGLSLMIKGWLDARSAMGDCDTAFMARDSHWRPEAARRVATAIAAMAPELPQKAFVELSPQPSTHEGDLMRFAPVGVLASAFGLVPESVETIAAEAEATDLFASEEVAVALVGTSYSAQAQWGFADALRVALQADLLEFTEEGQGPLRPMENFLSQIDELETPPKLVIWEIPVRYADMELPR